MVILLFAVAALAGGTALAAERSGLRIVSHIDLGRGPSSMAVHEGAVWVSLGTEGIVRLEPSSNQPVEQLRPGGAVIALATDFGSVWALDLFGDRLLRIDPHTNSVAATAVRELPTGLAVGHGSIRVVSQLESTVSRIDPATGREVARLRSAENELRPGGIAATSDGVWVDSTQPPAHSRLSCDCRKPTISARSLSRETCGSAI